MATAQRVKVRADALITRIEEAKVAATKRHADRLIQYADEKAEYRRLLAEKARAERAVRKLLSAKLREKAKEVLDPKVDIDWESSWRSGGYVNDRVQAEVRLNQDELPPDDPKEPSEPVLDLDDYDRDIKLLQMSAEDVISISTSDRWSRYL